MKILVFSDSHGDTLNMKLAVEQERPDRIFHLGDVVRDAQNLGAIFPDIPLEHVCGNCDFAIGAPNQLIADAKGRRMLLTHGHLYQVKLGIGSAVQAARKAGVDVLAFGHTHEALCTLHDGLWILNPGSIRGGFKPSYGVILLENDAITCHIMELE